LIWCAFAVEFILMVSSTKKKLLYVKKNWIDLAIILLPLVSFLRSLKIVRAAKLAKFAKVQQLTKMGRVYRMRGLLAKTVRAFLVLELVHRIFKTSPEKRLEQLLAQAEDKEDELRELQQRITAVRAQMESESAESESAESENTESEKVEPESSVVAATD
jgi:voltage-gated potassium channel